MHIPDIDFSDLSPKEAVQVQRRLASQVVIAPLSRPPTTVAGIDVAIRGRTAKAAVVALSYPDLDVLEQEVAELPVAFPYVPGLLAFREIPVVLEALRQLKITPDVLMCDGQGLAHPRRMGLATHLGLVLDWPTIGCAKSRLVGTHGPVAAERGAWQPLEDQGETIGAAVRTRPGVKPVYVSPGHKADLATTISIVLVCAPRYRIPEPTRLAHTLASIGPVQFAAALEARRTKR